jgi:hypothetical protein
MDVITKLASDAFWRCRDGLTISNRMIHISDFYQMFQSLKQFLEDYVPKNVMKNFRPVGARETVNKLKFRSFITLRPKWFFDKLHRSCLF